MNPYDTGVSIDPEFPVRNDPAPNNGLTGRLGEFTDSRGIVFQCRVTGMISEGIISINYCRDGKKITGAVIIANEFRPDKPKVTANESMARWRAKQRIPDYRPRKGEMPMKQWRILQADLADVSPSAIANRLMRGEYPHIKIRRVNKRVVYVST